MCSTVSNHQWGPAVPTKEGKCEGGIPVHLLLMPLSDLSQEAVGGKLPDRENHEIRGNGGCSKPLGLEELLGSTR